MANRPKLFLADEPTGALDSRSAQTLLETFTDLNQSMGATILMVTHDAFSVSFRKEDRTPDMAEIEKELKDGGVYCTFDTYMGISDYNALRSMLGYPEVILGPEEYLVQIKPRLADEVQGIGQDLKLFDAAGTGVLSLAGIYSDPFSQDGHNGGDYVIVVPDEVLERMQPYYSELAVDIDGQAPSELVRRLDALTEESERDSRGHAVSPLEGNSCCGSDNIVSYTANNLVRDNLIPEVKYMLASLIIPLFYIGLVFVCVAMTVLSVQQLSDSAKYKFRYDVLAKLGLERTRIRQLIRRQLAAYYLCPAALGILISGKMILFMSRGFVELTGVPVSPSSFFIKSIALFFGIYLVYYAVTYIGFIRNVEGEF